MKRNIMRHQIEMTIKISTDPDVGGPRWQRLRDESKHFKFAFVAY